MRSASNRRVAGCAFAVALVLGASAAAEPALYRVTDADNTVWLFGSVHALPRTLDWRSPTLDAALEAAEVVYFETHVDPFSQLGAIDDVIATGVDIFAPPLSERLSPEGAAALVETAAEYGLSLADLDGMRPWLAYLTVAGAMASRLDLEQSYGVEVLLNLEALKRKKPVRVFEDTGGQVRILADIPDDVMLSVLELTLLDRATQVETLREMVTVWAAGDDARVVTLMQEASEGVPPAFWEALLDRRNRAWMAEIEALIASDADALIVVGAAHLVGEGSVVALLEAAGHEVRRD